MNNSLHRLCKISIIPGQACDKYYLKKKIKKNNMESVPFCTCICILIMFCVNSEIKHFHCQEKPVFLTVIVSSTLDTLLKHPVST